MLDRRHPANSVSDSTRLKHTEDRDKPHGAETQGNFDSRSEPDRAQSVRPLSGQLWNKPIPVDDGKDNHHGHHRDLAGNQRLIGRGPIGRPAPEDKDRVDHAGCDNQHNGDMASGGKASQR